MWFLSRRFSKNDPACKRNRKGALSVMRTSGKKTYII